MTELGQSERVDLNAQRLAVAADGRDASRADAGLAQQGERCQRESAGQFDIDLADFIERNARG